LAGVVQTFPSFIGKNKAVPAAPPPHTALSQAVLDARAKHPGKSPAWLYNPETMPKNLQAAHDLIDEA
jgi:hypothetical protein